MNGFLSFITLNRVNGITLAPFGIYLQKFDSKTVNHEKIHWKQQMEMLIVPFYIWYSVEWLIRIPINGKKAYIKLLFEREAYNNDENLNYLETRKHFTWIF